MENGFLIGYYGGMTPRRRSSTGSDSSEHENATAPAAVEEHTKLPGINEDDLVYDGSEQSRLEAGINGGEVFVYFEVNADGDGRCYALIDDNRVDRPVLCLLLNDTAPPRFIAQFRPLIEDKRLLVDLDTRPSQEDFEKLHDRCIATLQIMREPTKEQAVVLAAHKEQTVRNYALAHMQDWSESWKCRKPRSAIKPPRQYHQR